MFQKTLAVLLIGCAALGAGEVKLMFGGNPKPVSGTKFLDFRYVSQKDPMFAPKSVVQGWNYNMSGGPAYGSFSNGSLPADTLLEHGVACRKGTMNVPFDGTTAFVRIWVGDWFAGQRRLWGRDPQIRLTVNGKTVYEERMTVEQASKEWCRLEEYVYSRRDSVWDRLVKPLLKVFTVEVPVKNGVVRFDMNNVLLTAVIIAPDRKTLDQAAEKMEQTRRAEFAKRYPWKPQPAEPMPTHNQKDLVLFQKSGLDRVNPWSRPKAEELREIPRVFAALGEQEMIRFGLLPLRDLKDLTVTVGDFKSVNGTISVTKNGDLWRERYKERGSEGTSGQISALWRLDPLSYVFQENKPQDAEEGTPRMYTLDMTVPVDAAPGDYYAPLTISAGGKVLRRARLRLKVLPFRLLYKGSAPYNFQKGDGLDWTSWREGFNKENIRKKLAARVAFLDKYHFHNGYFCPWGYWLPSLFKYGKITGKPGERQFSITPEQEANWDWWFNQIKKNDDAGFVLVKGGYLFLNLGWRYTQVFDACRKKTYNAEMKKQWDADLKDIERIVRQITEFGKKKGYPKFYWYFTGEIDNFGAIGAKEAIRLGEAINRAGAISFLTVNGPHAYKLTPAVYQHVWANPATPVDEGLKAAIEKHGHKFGTHNSGDTRFQAGFQFWRTGGEGRHQETQFYTDFMLPYVYLPWNYNTAQVYPTPDGGERPSLPFLNYRDGRDDYLYMYTLEQTMKKADKKSQAYQEAAEFIAHMKKKIHFDPRKYHTAKFDGIEATASLNENEWNSFSIERYRWRIATLIIALEKAR